MDVIEKMYRALRFAISRKGEKGEASSGFLPPRVRECVLSLMSVERGRICDMGCGEGLFVALAAAKFPVAHITGLEMTEWIMRAAEERMRNSCLKNADFILGDARGSGLPDGSFQTVVCLNMLYNLPSEKDVVAVIREMKRVCAQNGRIFFDIRNKVNPLVRFMYQYAFLYDLRSRQSLKAYTIVEIGNVLEKVGLKVRRVSPVVSFFGAMPFSYVIEAVKI
ncbi:MAG: class I SAM-dependent methyltransferase [Candidatus Omnitrophota bacterium]